MARIGLILVSLGATTESNVARALGVQGFSGGRLGTLLLERGSVTEEALGQALAQQHGRPYAPWSALGEVPPDVIASLPAKFAIRHAAIPYGRGEDYLRIALRDPGDLRIIDELFFVTGRKILPAVAPEVRIYEALEKYYGEQRAPRYTILGDKLSRQTRRRTRSSGPPPPPDFFSSGQQPAPPQQQPKPHEIWGDAAETDVAAQPIIQKWKIPDAPAMPWAVSPASAGKAAPEPPEEESITWEESPPPEMWLPESAAATPAPPEPPAAAPPAPVEARAAAPAPYSFGEASSSAVLSSFAKASEDKSEDTSEEPAEALPEIFVPVMPLPAAAPEVPAGAPAFAEASSAARAFGDKRAGARMLPSETDFPEVLAAHNRDDIAAAALAALSRRFGRAGFFVVRPTEVAGHSATGPGIDLEAFRAIAIPWSEPSVFLNVRLSRAFYLGPLPPLPRHRPLVEALGGSPEECLVQPVMMKDKPVAFLFVEFGLGKGASPMDLAYMRGLAAAAAGAFATAIRQKKREPV